jgi:hypothetical protein
MQLVEQPTVAFWRQRLPYRRPPVTDPRALAALEVRPTGFIEADRTCFSRRG